MEISRYGEDAIRIIFGSAITTEVHEEVRKFYFLMKALRPAGIIDMIPSFRACLIQFDPSVVSFYSLSEFIKKEGNSPFALLSRGWLKSPSNTGARTAWTWILFPPTPG